MKEAFEGAWGTQKLGKDRQTGTKNERAILEGHVSV
jgi:hypothetical protein